MIYPARYFFVFQKEKRMDTTQKQKTRILTECSIMIALSTVLSIIKVFEMPYGGSITLASMLPIVIIAHRYGAGYGFSAALVTSVIQALLGMKNFSYFTTPLSLIALGVFDYILAFGVFGIVGIFKKKIRSQSLAATVGALIASVLRYLCHVISGATVWAGLSIPTEAATLYSLSYNATYMIPETIILVLTTAYLTSSLDFTKKTPVRVHAEVLDKTSAILYSVAGLSVLGALITDTVLVFSKIQDAETGDFILSGLAEVNWLAFAIVTAICFVAALTLYLVAKNRNKNTAENSDSVNE